MTDRYYPKNYVPDTGPIETTYNEMNQMITHARSKFPPGYCGHEHGSGHKFGYSIPAPNPLPKEPVDPEDPLVNFRLGKKVKYDPLPCKELTLTRAPKAEKFVPVTIRGADTQRHYLTGEGALYNTFTPQTSAYLAHRTPGGHGDRGSRVDKDEPYTPAIFGQGTGFNSDSPYVSWLPPGKIEGTSTTKDHYPPPKDVRRGLEVIGIDAAEAAKNAVGTVVDDISATKTTPDDKLSAGTLAESTEYREKYNYLGENISYANC